MIDRGYALEDEQPLPAGKPEDAVHTPAYRPEIGAPIALASGYAGMEMPQDGHPLRGPGTSR